MITVNLKPALATEWAYQPDGKTVRLKLRTDVKFASGKPMTAEDVRFSFTRQLNIKDQPWQYIAHIEEVKVVDPHTVDIVLKDPTLPLMTIIATPAFGVLEKEVVVAHGGTDAPDAKEKDKATDVAEREFRRHRPVPPDRLAAQPADPDGEEPALLERHAAATSAC